MSGSFHGFDGNTHYRLNVTRSVALSGEFSSRIEMRFDDSYLAFYAEDAARLAAWLLETLPELREEPTKKEPAHE